MDSFFYTYDIFPLQFPAGYCANFRAKNVN
jgi:hypothetical protein